MLLTVPRSKSATELSKLYAAYGGASQIQWDRNWLFRVKKSGNTSTASDDWLIDANQRIVRTLDQIIGTWRDSRTVDEIVSDIYENRTL